MRTDHWPDGATSTKARIETTKASIETRTEGGHNSTAKVRLLFMTLLNSERVLSRVHTGTADLVLTTHRVVHGCQNKVTSIDLEDVGSVVVARLTHNWILAVTGTCVTMAACLVGMAVQD